MWHGLRTSPTAESAQRLVHPQTVDQFARFGEVEDRLGDERRGHGAPVFGGTPGGGSAPVQQPGQRHERHHRSQQFQLRGQGADGCLQLREQFRLEEVSELHERVARSKLHRGLSR